MIGGASTLLRRVTRPFFGQIIGARAEQGITQAQLAERVGTKQTNISRLERGEGNPTLEFMQKIATGLGKKLVIKLQ